MKEKNIHSTFASETGQQGYQPKSSQLIIGKTQIHAKSFQMEHSVTGDWWWRFHSNFFSYLWLSLKSFHILDWIFFFFLAVEDYEDIMLGVESCQATAVLWDALTTLEKPDVLAPGWSLGISRLAIKWPLCEEEKGNQNVTDCLSLL